MVPSAGNAIQSVPVDALLAFAAALIALRLAGDGRFHGTARRGSSRSCSAAS